MKSIIIFSLIFFSLIGFISCKCAFVTLIAGPEPEFIDGAVVLGKSLLKVKSADIDMILLHKSGLNMIESEMLTMNGGWVLKELSVNIPQPIGHVYKSRFVDMFDKFFIFSLTEYNTVVYLDADTLVVENIDELCYDVNAKIAAVMRGPTFNAGVMVIQPHQPTFVSLVEAVTKHNPNYPNNDQGLLNSIYKDFISCPYVDPLNLEERSNLVLDCARLPARYNGDVLIYAVNKNRWPYDPVTESYPAPQIIHYTFGDIKPWHWYSHILTPNVIQWWDIKKEAMDQQSTLMLSDDVVAISYLILLIICAFIFPNVIYSNWIDRYIYAPLAPYPNILLCTFLGWNVLFTLLSYIITSIYVFSPHVNTIIFIVLHTNFMRILLFNKACSPNAAVFTYGLMFFEIILEDMLVIFGESIDFFSRIAILVVFILIYQWFFCWTIFIQFVVTPYYKKYQQALKDEEKTI